MEEYFVKILEIEALTHDVKRYRVEKPAGYTFIPGHATEVAIDLDGWRDKLRPFTFTSLNEWDFLEFTIKSYRDHDGVTNKLDSLVPGNRLIIHEVWGAIQYEKPGLFIAGGAGITPFIAILRMLARNNQLAGNRLIFANKSPDDIILEKEFENILGDDFFNVLLYARDEDYKQGFVDEEIISHFLHTESDRVYLCGPEPMMNAVQLILTKLGFDSENLIVEH